MKIEPFTKVEVYANNNYLGTVEKVEQEEFDKVNIFWSMLFIREYKRLEGEVELLLKGADFYGNILNVTLWGEFQKETFPLSRHIYLQTKFKFYKSLIEG